MIQQAYICWLEFVASFNHLMFFKLKITNIFKSSELRITNKLKSSEWGLDKSELPWEHNFFNSHSYVSSRTISLTSFNGLC